MNFEGASGHAAAAYPLVSVIVRTMGRAELAQALASIADQTYPNIEVVVVDARGTNEILLSEHCGRFPMRVVGAGRRLLRAPAANAGLDAARGSYVGFLDEDDIMDPPHIALLTQALVEQPSFLASYSGIRVFLEPDIASLVYHLQYTREHLFVRNYLNPQAVLFSRALLDLGCRFDESFDILEDWDFWLQISAHTAFLRVDAITGNWRAWLGQSGAGAAGNFDVAKVRDVEKRLKQKWADVATVLNAGITKLLRSGLAAQAQGDWEEAKRCYVEATGRNPYDVNALNLLGMAELHFGKVELAIEYLQQANLNAAHLWAESPGLLYNLGLALEVAGRHEEAKAKYLRVVELDPAFAKARAKVPGTDLARGQ